LRRTSTTETKLFSDWIQNWGTLTIWNWQNLMLLNGHGSNWNSNANARERNNGSSGKILVSWKDLLWIKGKWTGLTLIWNRVNDVKVYLLEK